ncbi:MAG: APC family permease [Limosilactobacillus mucosae]|nr:APC family permease [Limosilactobacillus mucosae]
MPNHQAGKISFASVFLFGINSMVGSGIFLLPGVLFQDAGNWSLALILLAALAVLAMAYCYAEMAHHFSGNGAGWYYTYKEFADFGALRLGCLPGCRVPRRLLLRSRHFYAGCDHGCRD